MEDILKSTFDNEAKIYDETASFLLLDYNYVLEQVVEQIDMPTNSKFYILDVGCGTGNLITKIRKKYPRAIIYALDFSKDMVDIAKSKQIVDIRYVIEDMFELNEINLPYFDFIVSSYVFHNFHSIEEHKRMFALINSHLACNGKFILADLIYLRDPFDRKQIKKRMIELMQEHGVSHEEVVKWFRILEVEDFPLSIEENIQTLKQNAFEDIRVNLYNNNAIFVAKKQIDIIQLKAELLMHGIKQNGLTKRVFCEQNPEGVWKTGNNGIFLIINELEVLVSTNHKMNRVSMYELEEKAERIVLLRNKVVLPVNVSFLKFPTWFLGTIEELGEVPFSRYFVYEGKGFLHLAYKGCGFTTEEKCKFCSTNRRSITTDNDVDDICVAISSIIDKVPKDTHICLGGGTYIPFEENVEYFSKIIRCIRKKNREIPIWVESIPPSIENIERLIKDGATSFGFNIEIWDDELRKEICPGKSRISREHYLEACKYVKRRLGINRIGSCIIVGLNAYDKALEAINHFATEGIVPCVLPYKKFNHTNLGTYSIPVEYQYDFYRLSKYAAMISKQSGVIFNQSQGCLKCSCCTIMHDFQNKMI